MTTTHENAQLLGRGFYWQELQAGQRFRTFRRTVTETDLVNFISATGMLEAIFIDADFEHGAMSGRPVPGALTSGLIEGLLFQTMVQGTGLAMLEFSMKAHAPVLVNDTIYGVVEVEEVKPTSKHNRAVVTSRVEVLNQRDELVLSYTVKRMLAGRPE
ncbi:MaoC_dehydrat_N domain-containing protein [Paraburkholderia unamae]|uniref:MaoC family dehydratase n=1 Tax=Paraburkholderia unamae TaxID=219649 RepID=UPI000DC53E21|nr:MaoC family dehydratase [Paraburkholderia unamae]RAR51330.1 acyl dehydratase [Paraburkholderia unamae]CAG9274546.1 MaoC_dehydrat_N domain-containing protein [Paraburkholderia unamae]